MYVGRFLIAAPGIAAYRVSSRSFPNRRIVDRNGTLTVAPTPDAPATDNPYVSYNCLRRVNRPDDPAAVIGNGSHVDPIAGKVDLGYPARDALAEGLLALDFERDDYDTPRIAGVVTADAATVGIVRRDALLVKGVGEPTLVATYERDSLDPHPLAADTAADAAREAYAADFAHAVCAAGVTVGERLTTAIENGDDNLVEHGG